MLPNILRHRGGFFLFFPLKNEEWAFISNFRGGTSKSIQIIINRKQIVSPNMLLLKDIITMQWEVNFLRNLIIKIISDEKMEETSHWMNKIYNVVSNYYFYYLDALNVEVIVG